MVGTIVVDTDPDIAVARLVEHRGFTEADARARMARQASRDERLAKADFVIHNDGAPDDLGPQIDACWDWIRRSADRRRPGGPAPRSALRAGAGGGPGRSA